MKACEYSDKVIEHLEKVFDIMIWATSWQNQQNGMCTQQRFGSALASAQSDQSLRCPHEKSLDP